jgi:hypothetical protein
MLSWELYIWQEYESHMIHESNRFIRIDIHEI